MGAERLVPDDHGGAAAAAVGMLADAPGVNVSHPRTVSPFGSGVKGEHLQDVQSVWAAASAIRCRSRAASSRSVKAAICCSS